MILAVFLVLFFLWFFEHESKEEAPNEDDLSRRFAAAVELGWGWLHLEDLKILSLEESGKDYLVKFKYTVVPELDKAELPETQIDRFRHFLPMCPETSLVKGGRCSVREPVLFVFTRKFGWMPKVFLEGRPDLLPEIMLKAVESKKHSELERKTSE